MIILYNRRCEPVFFSNAVGAFPTALVLSHRQFPRRVNYHFCTQCGFPRQRCTIFVRHLGFCQKVAETWANTIKEPHIVEDDIRKAIRDRLKALDLSVIDLATEIEARPENLY
jgi:hypothetical protein